MEKCGKYVNYSCVTFEVVIFRFRAGLRWGGMRRFAVWWDEAGRFGRRQDRQLFVFDLLIFHLLALRCLFG